MDNYLMKTLKKVEIWVKEESKNSFKFYRSKLNEEERRCYDSFFDAFSTFKTECRMFNRKMSICCRAYEACIYDNPLFFYIGEVSFRFGSGGMFAKISYEIPPKELLTIRNEMDRIIKLVRSKCNGKSEFDKEILIHNTLVKELGYKSSNRIPVHSSYSAFMYRKAVCDGISKMTKILMDAVGIPTIIVLGSSNHTNNQHKYDNNLERINHAWNIVCVNGNYYHLDLTFDLNLSENGIIRYDYFNLTDDQISRDHCYNISINTSTEIRDYYSCNERFFTSKNKLKRYLEKELISGRKEMSFRLPYTMNPEYTYHTICDIIKKTFQNNVKSFEKYYISFNKEQMVVAIWLI